MQDVRGSIFVSISDPWLFKHSTLLVVDQPVTVARVEKESQEWTAVIVVGIGVPLDSHVVTRGVGHCWEFASLVKMSQGV